MEGLESFLLFAFYHANQRRKLRNFNRKKGLKRLKAVGLK